MKTKYDWKRYWSPPEGRISLTSEGFLEDPTSSIGKYANPYLASLDANDDTHCLVLLGEPGIGKSTEINDLFYATCEEKGDEHVLWIDLKDIPSIDIFKNELTNDSRYQNWVNKGTPLFLFLDSFDEGVFSFKSFANYFSLLLSKHDDRLQTLYLRISCRTAMWPSYLENKLKPLWENEEVKKYELCPLTKDDVIKAIEAKGIDKSVFLDELRQKDVVGFASTPLTLNFLLDLYKQEGQLPNSKYKIYLMGCEKLLQEFDQSKKNSFTSKSTLSLVQKLTIAERIAVATLISGKPTIIIDGEQRKGDVGLDELHGTEIISDIPFAISDEKIIEVLNSGLFSSRGNERMGWAHQSYGEFLAARYFSLHSLEWKQIQSLLFHDPLKTGDFKLVPQLYEVGAWLASLDSKFFNKAVLLDPEFLLLSDVYAFTDSQKLKLTEQLLTRLEKGEIDERWEIYNITNYRKLWHPEIAAQLEPYITDPTKASVVRKAAIRIASACAETTLEELLLKVAFCETDDLYIRVQAVLALANFGSNKSRQSLKQLVESGFPNDNIDELKGAVLEALWPNHISIQDVFNLITFPQKSNVHGIYFRFIGEKLASSLGADAVIPGLTWIERSILYIKKSNYSFKKLYDAIMLKALENIFVPEILERFAHIIYVRLVLCHKGYD